VHTVDWVIVAAYFVMSALVGVYFSKRAGKNSDEFFLSGRSLPWWLAGTSMVATTFAADTPLAVTEMVAKNGIAGNWMWWNFVFGGMLTTFFFARLWRRAEIMTDAEFSELRYGGKPAAFLRGFRALYLGVFLNCIIIAWVNLAMASVLQGIFGLSPSAVKITVFASLLLTAGYSALSGLWGVVVTDAIQFVLAMSGCIVLAVMVLKLPQVGGMAGLQAKLPEWVFRFTPVVNGSASSSAGGVLSMSAAAFFAFIGVQWWSAWYPGSEPGGGGYVAQRMMSTKDERHSVFSTLWFTIANYCIRPWPWIIVGLTTLVLYPDLAADQKRLGYVYAMRDYLPVGLKGLLVASFFAAYMSTISTQVNWGSSYVINDFYRRFVAKGASEKKIVAVSRITTVVLALLSVYVMTQLDTISDAWAFLMEAGAGFGLVLILRWFWWRINAWSEISAMLASLVASGVLRAFTDIKFPISLYYVVGFSTVVWLAVTFLTSPEKDDVLISFYRRVRPGGMLWRRISTKIPDVKGDCDFGVMFVNWVSGVVLVYTFLFGIGDLILAKYALASLMFVIGISCGFIIWHNLARYTAPAK